MKTNDFIKYFKNEGLRVYEFDNGILVQNGCHENLIQLKNDKDITIDINRFPFDTQTRYYAVIFKYLSTPPEEREEEKKYQLRQIGVHDRYLIWLSELEFWTTGSSYHDDIKTVFTQSEIDNMPECYTHPAVWEQVRVEEQDNV